MRIIYRQGKFFRLNEYRSNDNSEPHEFVGEQVTPKEGDTIQHPYDAMGYVPGWLSKVERALPEGLALGYGGGLDNDIYLIEKE